MNSGILGTDTSGLGTLTLGGAPLLGDLVGSTPGLVLFYKCDDPLARSTVLDVFGRDATVNLGTAAYALAEGVDRSALTTPAAAAPVGPPPYTKGVATHATFDYTGGDLAVGDAGTIEVWFRPSEFGDASRFDGGVTTPQADYEFFRLENPGVSKITFRTSQVGANPILRAAFSQASWDGLDGSLLFGAFADGEGDLADLPLIPPCEANRWYYLVFGWDQTSTQMYTNGALAEEWVSNHPAAALNANNVHFGGSGGTYDLVSVVNRKLTADEIAARFRAGADTPTTALVRVTNVVASYAATYDAHARVTKEIVEVLRTGSRNARVTDFRVEVMRTVEAVVVDTASASQTLSFTETAVFHPRVVDTETASQTLAFAESASGYKPVTHTGVIAQSLAFTQDARRTREGAAEQSLSFTQAAALATIHQTSQTLTFTETTARQMLRTRSLLQLLAFTETTAQGHDANLSAGDTLVPTQSASLWRIWERTSLHLLAFTQVASGHVVHSGSALQTLAFTQTDAGVDHPTDHGSASQALAFTQTTGLRQTHAPHVTQTLVFTQAAPPTPRVIVRSVTQRLAFYGPEVPTALPLLVGGVPVVVSLPVARLLAVTPTVLLQTKTGVIVLPAPEFNDAQGSYDKVNVRRTMVGGYYTYVQTSPVRTLKYTFVLGRRKALELRAFVAANLSAVVTLTDWEARRFVGQIVTNPLPLTTDARYAGAYERVTASFDFEGVPV